MASTRPTGRRGPGSLDAIEIAMDAELEGVMPDSPTLRLLAKQERLIDAEYHLARDARFSNRIKAVRDIALGLGALFVLGLAGWMVWDAARADDLVLEAWTAPPAFAAAGQGGEVLAAQLGDRIRMMQQKGESEATGAAKAAGGQSTDLTLEIPSTGVSIGELSRWLRRTLGHQTVVGGSVVQNPDGRLTVTVRPGDGAAASVEGTAAELPALLDKAAEATMRQTDPLRYAGFLIAARRLDEAAAAVEPLTYRGTASERANAMANMVNILNYQHRPRDALVLARRAAALDPDSTAAVGYLGGIEMSLGHEEEAYAAARRMVGLVRSRGEAGISQYLREENPVLWPTLAASQIGDTRASTSGFRKLSDLAAAWGNPGRARMWGYLEAGAWLDAHDVGAARTAMPKVPPNQLTNIDAFTGRRIIARARADLGRPAEANALAAEAVALQRKYRVQPMEDFVLQEGPALTILMAQAGNLKGAHDLIDASPMDCGPCVRARAILAAAERDWPRADRFFALSTRLAPSMPQGWSAWGQASAARDDIPGAIALYRRAQKAGPGWADPLKFEGDALLRQGKTAEAVKRYALAGERAPKWGALQLAWGDALDKTGRKDEAVARWRAALGCEMSAADRAAVKGRLAKAGTPLQHERSSSKNT